MLTAQKLKEVIDKNKRYLKIRNRAEMDQMVYFVADLLKASGYEDAAYFAKALGDELEDMDVKDIIEAKIWK